MPQMQLPFFPHGATEISTHLAVLRDGDQMTYIYGHLPIFTHHVKDVRTFRMITSQLYINGSVTQSEICRSFGVTSISVKRGVKLCREKDVAGFYEERRTRGAAVLTEAVLKGAQCLLDEGMELSDVAKQLGLKKETLRKAVKAGRLHAQKNITISSLNPTTKSGRSAVDAAAPMGMGATNALERVAASLGALEAVEPRFVASMDVANAGVLFALPALLVSGLLSHAEKYFQLPSGYYRLDSIFLLLAFMALARIKTVEALRLCAPGEWGKALGMDRIPEAKTLREKVGLLSQDERPSRWAAELCREWMMNDPDNAAVLYIDGHVRVYSGSQTQLPKHYVSRQKLCLRATVDYWVNAMDGRPFLVINKDVDPGLISVLEEDIIPVLQKDVPNQPAEQQLSKDPLLHRFTVIFDREGYSPKLFARLKTQRIACITYRKYPGDDWLEAEFVLQQVVLSSGNIVEMRLAERGIFLGGIWIREVRKLTQSGHQTSILSTDYKSDLKAIAVAMFARWSQENFIKYMRNHYNLDRLIEYSTEEIPDTTKVVNPDYRRIDGEVRKKRGALTKLCAQFGAITFTDEIAPRAAEEYQQQKAELQEEIGALQKDVDDLKQRRKAMKRHITIGELPQEERFNRLSTQSKYLIDAIKMTAYRAETAMVSLVREKMSHPDEARSFLRAIYTTEADILPDPSAGTLTVRLHHLANYCSSELIRRLCDELNSTETIFPGTKLRLIYDLVSPQFP